MKKMLTFSLLGLLLLSSASFATWPTFDVISPETIMSKLVTQNGCAAGGGRILPGTKVKINSHYIPSNQTWYWVYTGSDACRLLPKVLDYLTYYQSGREGGDTITAFYGTPEQVLFKFTFTIPKHWDCGLFKGPIPPVTVGCAQDT